MLYSSLFTLALSLFLTKLVAADVSCYTSGQPFDESWSTNRLTHACHELSGDYLAGQTKRTCVEMGSDHVDMRASNVKGHEESLQAHTCEKAMHHIITECGGFGAENHGGKSEDDAWDFT